MTAPTTIDGDVMLTDDLQSNPLFEALKLAVGMLSLHGHEDDAKKVVAEAKRVARSTGPVAKVTNYRDTDGDLRAGVVFLGKSPAAGTLLYTSSPAAPAQSGEPIYQVQDALGKWCDVREQYWPLFELHTRRIVYAAPQTSQPAKAGEAITSAPAAMCRHDLVVLWDSIVAHSIEDELMEFAEEVLARYAAPRPSELAEWEEQFDTDFLCVDSFAEAMKQKLLAARLKGRSGWQDCDPEDLSRMLREHVEKGDPRDVANFCMMLWHLEQPITAQSAVVLDGERAIVRELQKALFYWMPRIAGEDSPAGKKAAEHAYLLIGLDDNSTECWGDQILHYVGTVNREQERLGVILSDAGCTEDDDYLEFIQNLAARAASPQATAMLPVLTERALTDDERNAIEVALAWVPRRGAPEVHEVLRALLTAAHPASDGGDRG